MNNKASYLCHTEFDVVIYKSMLDWKSEIVGRKNDEMNIFTSEKSQE